MNEFSPLLISYGNTLRGDDGVGPLVARHVKAELGSRIEWLSHTGILPEMAEALSQASRVLFIDASVDVSAGDCCLRNLDLPPASSNWALGHSLSPSQLLLVTQALYGPPPPAALLAIGGFRWGPGEPISPALYDTVVKAVDMAVEYLAGASVPLNCDATAAV